jgi:acyl-CoA dehydrogenase
VAVKQGLIEPMPISATAFTAWRVKARALDLISDDEDTLLGRYVEYADHGIQVDDFPQDFGLLEALQQRQQALEQAAKPTARRRASQGENAPVN